MFPVTASPTLLHGGYLCTQVTPGLPSLLQHKCTKQHRLVTNLDKHLGSS